MILKLNKIILVGVVFSNSIAFANTGIATFYTEKSCKKEGTSGIYTASGEKFNENAFTCAMRNRNWGKKFKVTNLKNNKSVIVRLNDFGPGKKATKRGVIIDLTPIAFDYLGGKRGENWGEIKVNVEEIK